MGEHKSHAWIWVAIIIGIAIVVGAIILSSNQSPTKQSSSCSSGYYWTGSSCCYDSDNNQVCDNEQKFFQYALDCNGLYDMSPCVNMCISKCSEKGLRIAVSAVHGQDLASYPGSDGKFYCNCVPN